MNGPQRREAYSADVTYVTNQELGFDYLRDHLAVSNEGELIEDFLRMAMVVTFARDRPRLDRLVFLSVVRSPSRLVVRLVRPFGKLVGVNQTIDRPFHC